ncbi:MAG: c-type cytochrome, partial [Anaerolineae bacterium]
ALAANTAGTDLTTELPPGDAARGELLFGEGYNCISCHSLDGTDGVGPSIQGLGDRAATRIADYTAQEYLRESILLPCDYVVAGSPCVMPQDYGERMTYQDLADLIAYLLEN